MRDIRKKNSLPESPPPESSRFVSSDTSPPSIDREAQKEAEVALIRLEKQKKKANRRRAGETVFGTVFRTLLEVADRVLRFLATSWVVRLGLVAVFCVLALIGWQSQVRRRAIEADILAHQTVMLEELVAFHEALDATLAPSLDDPPVPDALIIYGAVQPVVRAELAAFLEAPTAAEAEEASLEVVEMYQTQLAAVLGAADQSDVISRRRTWMRIEELVEKRDDYLGSREAWHAVAVAHDPSVDLQAVVNEAFPEYAPRQLAADIPGGRSMELEVVRALPSNVADAERREAEGRSDVLWDDPTMLPAHGLDADSVLGTTLPDADVEEQKPPPPKRPAAATTTPAPPPEPGATSAPPTEQAATDEDAKIEVRTSGDKSSGETIRVHRGGLE